MDEEPPPSYPPLPIGSGETQTDLFRTVAEQSQHGNVTPGPRSPPRTSVLTLQRRIAAAAGDPVRLGRYHVYRAIGQGGMGVVYEAEHVETGQRVALKTLRFNDPQSLLRFKNEFRSLRGVAHPNLVTLYELGFADDQWFYTMEFVDGVGFVEHVQRNVERPGWEYLGETLDASLPGMEIRPREPSAPRIRRGYHEPRLRAALAKLAAAVAALHDLGKLHRDLNPGNVLVTREGRVVVLDFGLITDRTRGSLVPFDSQSGTPVYMSPEQAAGKPATSASDWYGFGVMLFEALTGQVPFDGNSMRVLATKRLHDAPRASSMVSGIPADLDDLCAALLSRHPDARPDGEEVMRRLGASSSPMRAPAGDIFEGREGELHALDEAFTDAVGGRPVVALVHGEAGMGKSALIARFLAAREEHRDALVVRASCHERETLPRRVADAVVDTLASALAALPEATVHAMLPGGVRSLARLFPVLGLVKALGTLPSAPEEEDEEVRACFADLCARLSMIRPLVIAVDDAHLAGAEDARWLSALATREAAALIVLGHAEEDLIASPVLAELGEAPRRIALGPLDPDTACALARRFLPADRADAAPAVAAASQGVPHAIEELACFAVEQPREEISRERALAARLAQLPESALDLVEIAAAAGAPLPRSVLLSVAGVGPLAEPALATLSAARLLRVTGLDGHDRVSVYDEAARAAVLAQTPPPVSRGIHRALGHALAADPEVAAGHFHRAGALDLAVSHALAAAEATRDHRRAAALLDRAHAWAIEGSLDVGALAVRRAEAYWRADHAAAAAQAFLEAAARAKPTEAAELRLRAADGWFVCGRAREALDLIGPALTSHGVRRPGEARGRARMRVLVHLADLSLRGFTLPEPRAVAAQERPLLDALWIAGRGLVPVDPASAAYFVTETLRRARAAGDTALAARALALTGTLIAAPGGKGEQARGQELIEAVTRFAQRSGDAHLLAFAWSCSGLARLCASRFREALSRADESARMLEDAGGCVTWERNMCHGVALRALYALGALRERARRAEGWIAEARGKGDRFGESLGWVCVGTARLAAGDPRGAREASAEALALSWPGAFGITQQNALWIEVWSFLYEGDPAAAHGHLRDRWPALHSSELMRFQPMRVDSLLVRGAVAVAASSALRREREDLLRRTERDAQRLAQERGPHAQGAAAALRAGVANARGEPARALAALEEAARSWSAAEMRLHAAAAQRCRGALLGGDEGRALIAEADTQLTTEGVRDPTRWAALVSGFAR